MSFIRGVVRGVVRPVARGVVTPGVAGGGATYLQDWYLIAEGDSITASTDPSPESYARLLPALYNPSPGLSVPAVAGTNMTSMEGRAATVDGIISDESDRDMVILSTMMSNGLIEYVATTLYEHMIDYWAARRAAGAKIIACTFLPRDNDVSAPGWSDGDPPSTFNDLQRSDPSLYDELCDFAAKDYGQLAAASDTDLYPDGIHPSSSVYESMSQDFKTAINNLINEARPVCTVAPSITGTVRNGETLTCSTGTWSQGSTFAYQWFRLDSAVGYQVPISGETSATYQVQPEDVDCTLKCNVSCTNAGVTAWTATEFTDVVESYYGPELILNGRAAVNTSSWTTAAGGSLSATGGVFTLTEGSTNARFSQSITTVVGEWYRLTVDFTLGVNSVAGRSFIQPTAETNGYTIVDCPTSDGYITTFQATSTSTAIDFRDPSTAAASTTWVWDNISIKHIADNPYDAFAAQDFTTTAFTLTSNTTASAGAGDGPDSRSDEYDVSIADGGYHYRSPMNWYDTNYFGVGDAITVRVWVQGTAGMKIPMRVTSNAGGSGSFVLHTCSGDWEIVEVTHTITGSVVGAVGFDNRDFIVTGAGLAAATFKVWGLSVVAA